MKKAKSMQIIKDQYRTSRGDYSQLLNLHCFKCDYLVAVYQKDGPGPLKRLYLDRILTPDKWRQYSNYSLKDWNKIPYLKCDGCDAILGVAKIYEKENRLCYHLLIEAIREEVKK